MKKINMLYMDFVISMTIVIVFLFVGILSKIHINKIASMSVLLFGTIIIIAVIEAVCYQEYTTKTK